MQFEINNRIKLLIEKLEVTPYEFSKRIGNKRPDGLYQILKNEAEPSPKTLNKIFEIYPEYKVWLLTGSGEKLTDTKVISEQESSTLPGIKCTNPDCLNKIKKLTKDLNTANEDKSLLKEHIALLKAQIKQLKSEKGAVQPEKRDSGSVEKPGETKKAS